MTTLKQLGPCVLALICGMTLGCGDSASRPATIAVSGSVMYQGKPVEGAEVVFWGKNAPKDASGVTDKDGKFTLSMFEPNDGCLPGENVVIVTKKDSSKSAAPAVTPEQMLSDPTALAKAGSQQSSSKEAGPKMLIPEKYSSKSTTPLKADVSASNNSFPFTLTD